jgi:hypothetical protein
MATQRPKKAQPTSVRSSITQVGQPAVRQSDLVRRQQLGEHQTESSASATNYAN